MEYVNTFRANWNYIFFMNLAEAALWGYFFIQLGLVLINFWQLRDYFKTGQTDNPPVLTYIKRAGTALVVVGVIKLVQLLFTAFASKSFGL